MLAAADERDDGGEIDRMLLPPRQREAVLGFREPGVEHF
jgi:hypothetical protein